MNKIIHSGQLSGTISIMPSKSASHRAILLASLSQGETQLAPLQLSEDISATLACVQQLGLTGGIVTVNGESSNFIRIRILGRMSKDKMPNSRTLECGESGSTLRFMIPMALDGNGPVHFIGRGRLMQRPLEIYENLVQEQGLSWQLRGNDLTVDGKLNAGTYSLPGNVSSQFITGLLLTLPHLEGDSSILLTSPLESSAYVEMTRDIQAAFGVHSEWQRDHTRLFIPGRQIARSPGSFQIEGDWSHAAFYLTAGAIGKEPLTLEGLSLESTQGDRVMLDFLAQMGASITTGTKTITVFPSDLHAIDADVSQCPDLVPILAVAMAAAHGQSTITGAARLRLKESDRLSAMADALTALGASIREKDDGLVINGGFHLKGGTVNGMNDHRIVMAMAIASALTKDAVTITDAQAVAKSAPAFWDEFASLGGVADEG